MTVVFTADVIKQMATPYELSDDLMQATLAALAPPPAGADATRRQVRLVRLVAEVAAFQPADAAQARLAAQILVLRELADALAQRAHAPEVTPEQMCRLSRGSAELLRTCVSLERTLSRRQMQPMPFCGSAVADRIDIAALDATWGKPAPPVCDDAPTADGADHAARIRGRGAWRHHGLAPWFMPVGARLNHGPAPMPRKINTN